MISIRIRPWHYLIAAASLLVASASLNPARSDAALDDKVAASLRHCQQISTSCAASTQNAVGVLVFPDVIKADLIVGGAGGKGALIENGRITGYYNIGAITAGLQAGIENVTHVYVFRSPGALAKLKEGADWKAGAEASATLITADASERRTDGDVLVYVFDAKGLHAGISLDAFRIWKAGQARPQM